MSKTVTFRDVDNLWEITVKEEFLKKCPNPNNETIEDLAKKYKFYEHLHNPYGPALSGQVYGKSVRLYFIEAQLIYPDTDEGKAKIKEIQKLEK